jgi:hypothetical protein
MDTREAVELIQKATEEVLIRLYEGNKVLEAEQLEEAIEHLGL